MPTAKVENASVQRIVIPAADVLRALILPVQPNEVEHVFALDRACQPHIRNENAERITRSIDSDLMMLAASTLIVAALDEHVGCTDPFFITQPTACLCISAVRRRAIAPQDNARVNQRTKSNEVVKMESDTMGAKRSIRRLANPTA